MSQRIPSSLKWLIDKRARIDAEIKKTRASLKTAEALIKELSVLEVDLAAIDRSLGLHEIKIEVENIPPIRSNYVRIKLPHGELTRSILLCLRLKEGTPASMSTIAAFVEARHADLTAEKECRTALHRTIHYRLKNLCRSGVLQRHHPAETNGEGLWSLKDTSG
ncbi:MAG TPA: hypothetical protein PKD55_15050 [Bellilinea sp.]|nr:hypothetical protein [Bellilinea sp.]